MPSIRIRQFGGLLTDVSARLKPATYAQVAHNCLLRDGTLQPQAEWIPQEILNTGAGVRRSVAFDKLAHRPIMYEGLSPVQVDGQPFYDRSTYAVLPITESDVGVPPIIRYNTGDPSTYYKVNLENRTASGTAITGTVFFQAEYLSTKAVQRFYGATRVRKTENYTEESVLSVAAMDDNQISYEGDVANLSFTVPDVDDGTTHIRIYRTVSGFTTGDASNNALDTNWHLIAELPLTASGIVTFADGGCPALDPFDVLYSNSFSPLPIYPGWFGLTESGWFVSTARDGRDIVVSERYIPHAWPLENAMRVNEEINAAAIHKDTVYIGTIAGAYALGLAQSENGVRGAVTQYKERYACNPNTMVTTSSGAMYASPRGLVALSREGSQIVTKEYANPGDKLYTDGQTDVYISRTGVAAYHKGSYYGFVRRTDVTSPGAEYVAVYYFLYMEEGNIYAAFIIDPSTGISIGDTVLCHAPLASVMASADGREFLVADLRAGIDILRDESNEDVLPLVEGYDQAQLAGLYFTIV